MVGIVICIFFMNILIQSYKELGDANDIKKHSSVGLYATLALDCVVFCVSRYHTFVSKLFYIELKISYFPSSMGKLDEPFQKK